MQPIRFKKCNVIYGKNQDEYMTLPAFRADDDCGTIETRWRLSDEELKEVQKSGAICLRILTFGNSLQPVQLSVCSEEEK